MEVNTDSIPEIFTWAGEILFNILKEILKIIPALFGKSKVLAEAIATWMEIPDLAPGFEILITGISFIMGYALLKRLTYGMKNASTIIGVISIICIVAYIVSRGGV